MKILFLSDNFPPEVNAPANRTYEHCLEWVNQGADVTVITCFPNFPKGKIFSSYKNRLYQKEIINGIKVIRVWSYMAPNAGFAKRILDFISYAFMAFVFGLFQRFDVVLGTSPQFFTAISARCLALFKMGKWIMEVRDLWPDDIAAHGLLKRESIIFRFLLLIEIHLYRSAKAIVVNADGLKSSIVNKGISREKIKVIKNGINLSEFKLIERDELLQNKLNINGKFVISYIGTLGISHALDFILDCVKSVSDKKYHFMIIGDGAERENLIKKSIALNLENVTFLPPISREDVFKYISISDAALVNLKKSENYKLILPSKIFENVAMRKPILLGVDGEAKKMILSHKLGVYYEPENQQSFLKALKRIESINGLEFIANCETVINKHDRCKLAIEMLEFIRSEISV